MPPVVVDDRLLLSVLLREEPLAVARTRRHSRLFTTGLWYHRLCRAVGGGRVVGQLGGALAGAPPSAAATALASVIELPVAVGLVSLRDLGWPMGQLLRHHRLNLVALEAICAARRMGAIICVAEANDSPAMRRAAESLDVEVRAVAA